MVSLNPGADNLRLMNWRRIVALSSAVAFFPGCGLVETNPTVENETGGGPPAERRELRDTEVEPKGEGGAEGDSSVDDEFSLSCSSDPPECVPGEELCHSRIGRLVGCNACGELVLDEPGGLCFRALTMDKLFNIACGIRGLDEMVCAMHSNEGYGEPMMTTLRGNTHQLMIPNRDIQWFHYALGLVEEIPSYCTLDWEGKLYCEGGADAETWIPTDATCSKVIVDSPQESCALCEDTLYCRFPSTERQYENVSDFDLGDGDLFWIRDGDLWGDGLHPNPWTGGEFHLVHSNTLPNFCALARTGEATCNHDAQVFPGPYEQVLANGLDHGVGLLTDGRAQGVNFTENRTTYLTERRFQHLRGSVDASCGLTLAGEVYCWGVDGVPSRFPEE